MLTTNQTLGISALFSFVSGALYFLVGRVSHNRNKDGDVGFALRAFTTWWYGLGATSASGAVISLAAASGRLDVPLMLTATLALFALLCVCLWGLLYYLLYLFFGQRWIQWPLTAFYALFYFWLVYIIIVADPDGIQTKRWGAQLTYAHQPAASLGPLVLGLLLLPQMIGAIAYFSLYYKTRSPEQRYRIALISSSIFVWFGAGLVASIAGVSTGDAWQVASRLLGLVAPSMILMAYAPPKIVRHWFHLDAAPAVAVDR